MRIGFTKPPTNPQAGIQTARGVLRTYATSRPRASCSSLSFSPKMSTPPTTLDHQRCADLFAPGREAQRQQCFTRNRTPPPDPGTPTRGHPEGDVFDHGVPRPSVTTVSHRHKPPSERWCFLAGGVNSVDCHYVVTSNVVTAGSSPPCSPPKATRASASAKTFVPTAKIASRMAGARMPKKFVASAEPSRSPSHPRMD